MAHKGTDQGWFQRGRVRWGLSAILILCVLLWMGEKAKPTASGTLSREAILSFVNRGEGLGLFHGCEAQRVKLDVWHVMLCVPDPSSLEASMRSLMKPAVGLQAIFVLKELRTQYSDTAFVVWIIRKGTDPQRERYGYAYVNEKRGGPVYVEHRVYR